MSRGFLSQSASDTERFSTICFLAVMPLWFLNAAFTLGLRFLKSGEFHDWNFFLFYAYIRFSVRSLRFVTNCNTLWKWHDSGKYLPRLSLRSIKVSHYGHHVYAPTFCYVLLCFIKISSSSATISHDLLPQFQQYYHAWCTIWVSGRGLRVLPKKNLSWMNWWEV